MNKKEKELLKKQLEKEKEIISELKKVYQQAEKDIQDKIDHLLADELTQSKIYQAEYQRALRGQINAILDNMDANNYDNIMDYLKGCYEDGYVGTMYNLAGQGIPLIMPMDQEAVVKAIQLDSKISEGLYKKLGINTQELKKSISSEVARGISGGRSYKDMARNLNNQMKIGLNKSIRIARTEGHRVKQEATMDGMRRSKDEGADIVKQWDSTLDGKTRPSHQRVDGEIREMDEAFSNGLQFPGDPSGPAKEVVNCRCVLLQRAKWALDEDELETLKKRAEYFGLDKTSDFEDFKKKYLGAATESAYKEMTEDEYKKWRQEHDTRTHLLQDFIDDYRHVMPEGLAEKIMTNHKTGYNLLSWNDDFVIRENGESKWLREIMGEYLGKASGAINHYVQMADGSKEINAFWREMGNKDFNAKECREWVKKRLEDNWLGRKNAKKLAERVESHTKAIKEASESLDFLTKHGVIDEDMIVERWAGADALKHLGIDIGNPKAKRIGHAFCSDGIDLDDISNQIKGLKGTTITDSGYMSVSANADLNVFKGSDIKYKIMVPKGATAYITDNEYESELIFPRGSQLEITDCRIIDTEAEDTWNQKKEKRKSIEIIVKLVTD